MSAPGAAPSPGRLRALGRFLEIQNLGLNLPFALAFLLLAARGLPTVPVAVLVVVAFVAARNAGHSFNRWADRALDARNPRTRSRDLPAGRRSGAQALAIAAVSAAVLVAAAALLNPLSLALAPVALAMILGYSYTKRFTALTTPFLGLVEAITPAAAYVAVRGALPLPVLLAVAAILAWGTAFETVHSLGDVESDRALGLKSLPVRLGVTRSSRLVPILHAVALGLLTIYGLWADLRLPYFVALVAMAVIAGAGDRAFLRAPTSARAPFRRHFLLAGLFLAGAIVALFLPLGPSLGLP